MDAAVPLDAEELMLMADRLASLPADHAEWVARLYAECIRARVHEAELLSVGASIEEAAGSRLSEAQLAQVALDVAEWLKTLWDVGYMGAGRFPSQPRSAFPSIGADDVISSALFARIRQGKHPLPFPPPTRNGLPWHELIEGLENAYFVEAEIIRGAEGQHVLGARIEGDGGWKVVDTLDPLAEPESGRFIVQHQGRGPLFQLSISPPMASLRRLEAEWRRRIKRREQAGVCSYLLEWCGEDGARQDVPLRAASWERAESEAAFWIASHYPDMYGRVRFERVEA